MLSCPILTVTSVEHPLSEDLLTMFSNFLQNAIPKSDGLEFIGIPSEADLASFSGWIRVAFNKNAFLLLGFHSPTGRCLTTLSALFAARINGLDPSMLVTQESGTYTHAFEWRIAASRGIGAEISIAVAGEWESFLRELRNAETGAPKPYSPTDTPSELSRRKMVRIALGTSILSSPQKPPRVLLQPKARGVLSTHATVNLSTCLFPQQINCLLLNSRWSFIMSSLDLGVPEEEAAVLLNHQVNLHITLGEISLPLSEFLTLRQGSVLMVATNGPLRGVLTSGGELFASVEITPETSALHLKVEKLAETFSANERK